MQIPLQITLRDIRHSDELEKQIRRRAKKLDEFIDHIMSCRVVIEMTHKHHYQGKLFTVHIHIGLAGGEIVINRDNAKDVYVALRDAINAAKRQVREYAHMLRGDVKKHNPMLMKESLQR